MTTPKFIKDNQVAVLYSPGYGAGWSTWCSSGQNGEMLYCPELVEALLVGAPYKELVEIATRLFPEAYLGGLEDLTIEWVTVGQAFKIREYDGSESIEYNNGDSWFTP